LPSSPIEKYADEIKNPSTHEVEEMSDGGAVIFDSTESRQKQGRAFLTLVRVFVFEFVAGVPRRRTGAVDLACEFHHHPRTPPLPRARMPMLQSDS
jgi:hypothetical protein